MPRVGSAARRLLAGLSLLVSQPLLPATDRFAGVAAAYAVAVDGELLWGGNLDQPRPPASLAKLLTALVLLAPDWNADAEVTVSAAAARIEGSRIGLARGDRLRAGDLLTGMLVRSGNDACVALVEHAAGSLPAFAERMNRRAAALGMTASHFVHPCGLDAPGQASTARDLLKLAEAARLVPDIALRAGAQRGHIRTRAGRTLEFHNSNALIGRAPEATGLKSGYTRRAGNCVVALAERRGHYALVVLLDARERWWEATGLLALALARVAPPEE